MSAKNRFRFWDLARKSLGSTRRRRGGVTKKIDRAVHVEQLLALEPRLLMTSFFVSNLNDSGAGSFRQAVLDAALGGNIIFSPGLSGTLTLNSTIGLTSNVSIAGPGASAVTITGAAN